MTHRLSDREMLNGVLGGWIGHEKPRLVTDPIHSVDGSVQFVVRITVPAEAANRARDNYSDQTGPWAPALSTTVGGGVME